MAELCDDELAAMVRVQLEALHPRRLPERFSVRRPPEGSELYDKELAAMVRAQLEALQPRRLPDRFSMRRPRVWNRAALAAVAAVAAAALGFGTVAARPDLGSAVRSAFDAVRSGTLPHESPAPSSPPAVSPRQTTGSGSVPGPSGPVNDASPPGSGDTAPPDSVAPAGGDASGQAAPAESPAPAPQPSGGGEVLPVPQPAPPNVVPTPSAPRPPLPSLPPVPAPTVLPVPTPSLPVVPAPSLRPGSPGDASPQRDVADNQDAQPPVTRPVQAS